MLIHLGIAIPTSIQAVYGMLTVIRSTIGMKLGRCGGLSSLLLWTIICSVRAQGTYFCNTFMFSREIAYEAFIVQPRHHADCEYCLTVPCQSPIPDANNDVWRSCLPCLRQVYPNDCQIAVNCAYFFILLYNDPSRAMSCCSNVANILLSNVTQSMRGPSISCNAPPPPSVPRPSIAAATLPSTSSNGQLLQFIIPQMNFSCHGCFQTLNITLKEGVSSDSTFYFQLWRRYTPTGQTPVVTNELYQLNTSVPLTISTTSVSSSNVYSLPLDVCFHEGDTIGIQLPSNSLLRIATDNSSVIYKREVPAQCSDVVSGIFQPSLNYTGSPLITLVTAPSSPSPTPVTLIGTSTISKETPTAVLLGATPTANPCTDNCSTLIAKSSIAIGLGAAAFCAVAIVMMMLLYCTIKAMVDRKKYQCGNEILALGKYEQLLQYVFYVLLHPFYCNVIRP